MSEIALAALIGTLALTTIMSGSQWLGLSRMSIPFILGLMFTRDRDRAMVFGFGAHLCFGFVFALFYDGVFRVLGASWWLGLLLGLGHFLFVYLAALPIVPGVHPRMAGERDGPDPTRQLEPPGFLGLNYGTRTPLVGMIAHAVYGLILGAMSQTAG